MLRACLEPLWASYDVALLDLDGVVYVGADAVPGAPGFLSDARKHGMHLAFVTNNAARPPSAVAEHLTELGIEVEATEVVTSSQAAARVLMKKVGRGSKVFVVGGTGLYEALVAEELIPVQSFDESPVAVVSGYHPDLTWRTVVDGSILVARGLPWVATNADATLPTPHGPGPGHGVLVGAIASFSGVRPEVAGKPAPPLFQETIRRVGGSRPLVVGDRVDTDIEGAMRVGFDSLLVMTGVTGLSELVKIPRELRPTYVAADLAALGAPHGVPEMGALGGWRGSAEGGRLSIAGAGSRDDWWRVAAAVSWGHLDESGTPLAVDGLVVP